jgi:hypothetical protein
MDRAKLGRRLAYLVHTKHLSIIGLELMADAFTQFELQEMGRHIQYAREVLEQAEKARQVRRNLWKFTGEGDTP